MKWGNLTMTNTNSAMQNMVEGTQQLHAERQEKEKKMQLELETVATKKAEAEEKAKEAEAKEAQDLLNMTDSEKIELLTKAVMELTVKLGGTK